MTNEIVRKSTKGRAGPSSARRRFKFMELAAGVAYEHPSLAGSALKPQTFGLVARNLEGGEHVQAESYVHELTRICDEFGGWSPLLGCFAGFQRRRQRTRVCEGDHALSRIGQPHKHMAISMVPAADPLI